MGGEEEEKARGGGPTMLRRLGNAILYVMGLSKVFEGVKRRESRINSLLLLLSPLLRSHLST